MSLLNHVLGVLACSCALHVYVFACSRAWRVCVLTCWCAYVLGVLACLRAYVLACSRARVLGVLLCSRTLRAYMLAEMKCFTFLRVCVLGVLNTGVLTFLSNFSFCSHKSRLCN